MPMHRNCLLDHLTAADWIQWIPQKINKSKRQRICERDCLLFNCQCKGIIRHFCGLLCNKTILKEKL